jgi:hypothetical protein
MNTSDFQTNTFYFKFIISTKIFKWNFDLVRARNWLDETNPCKHLMSKDVMKSLVTPFHVTQNFNCLVMMFIM